MIVSMMCLILFTVHPNITSHSDYLSVNFNDNVTIRFNITEAFPNVPAYNITWLFKSLRAFEYIPIKQDGLSSDRLSLTITNVQLRHRGLYKIIAHNAAGKGEATIQLNVYYGKR